MEAIVIALAAMAFLWAYLYGKSPESVTPDGDVQISGFVFRLLFLGMTFFTMYILATVAVFGTDTETKVITYEYNESEFAAFPVSSTEVTTVSVSPGIMEGVSGYIGGMTSVIIVTFALILLIFLLNTITSIRRRK